MLIYICDDEQKILLDIVDKVKSCCPQSNIVSFSDSRELLISLFKKPCDILLLDIDMPQISGHDVAKQLMEMSCKPLLIFVTSHDELVYDSLKFHPFGFVRKSYFDEEVEKVINDCIVEIASRKQYFSFRVGSENIRLPVPEILFLESDGNYLKVITNSSKYRFRDTISNIEKDLSFKGFVRIHRGFLVNQLHTRKITSIEVELSNGCCLPIGRNYYETAKKQLMRYMMR